MEKELPSLDGSFSGALFAFSVYAFSSNVVGAGHRREPIPALPILPVIWVGFASRGCIRQSMAVIAGIDAAALRDRGADHYIGVVIQSKETR